MVTEVGIISNIIRYIENLNQKGEFTSESSEFRFNTIVRESYPNFKHWSSPFYFFRSSNRQDPSDCEINKASDIETSEILETLCKTSKQLSLTPIR